MKNLFKKYLLLLVTISAALALFACVSSVKHKVSFDLQGAPVTIETMLIKDKEKIPKPTDPIWSEHTFKGWYQSENFIETELWLFSSLVVTKAITLYAKWDESGNGDFVIPTAPNLAVRDAKGNNGMVAAASGYASDVGVAILEAGGNAFDAAVAVAFTLNVVEPNASGIGGGGFMVAYNGLTKNKLSYNYREFAPGLVDRSQYTGAGLGGTLELGDGAGSFGIPMFVDGLLTILNDQGTMSLEQVMRPAINLAKHGFPITKSLASAISDNYSKLLRETAVGESLNIYSDGLSPLKEGDLLINNNLANVLEKISIQGKDGFYKGEVARAIISSIRSGGSVATLEDMESAIGRTTNQNAQKPITGTYKDYELISMFPPSSGGTTLIEIFNMLEYYDSILTGGLKSLGHNSSNYLHAVGSATQLAFGDRRRFIGDPNFVEVPIQGLGSKEYAKERWLNFNPALAQIFSGPGGEYGDPWKYETTPVYRDSYNLSDEGQSASTTHFSIVDKFGNIVSSTNTINYFFGNGYMPSGTGIHLNNIMSPFSLNEVSVNLIKPYKVPLSNMSPSIILKDGDPFMAIGSPGSMRITSAIVQTVLNIMEFDMNIQEAIASPRIHQYVGVDMEIEGAIGDKVINELKVLGYNPKVYNNINLYFGGVQGIIISSGDTKFHGGADPRRDGKAVGY